MNQGASRMAEQSFKEISHQIINQYIKDLATQTDSVAELAFLEPEDLKNDYQDNKSELEENVNLQPPL